MFRFVRRDVIFLHPPSVYDFRKDTVLFGPISDVVPSSSVFEMYPMGITSIANHLEEAGYHVQVINVAYKMLQSAKYEPEDEIKKHDPRIWAIDLHWLPHVHGALALASMIKKHHPDVPIIVGGLTSSYYHEELIQNPNIDFIMRGDSTEEPMLQLLNTLRAGLDLDSVPNLTWKKIDGEIVVNPLSHVPETLDDTNLPAYKYMMRSVFKYWNLQNVVPYLRWLEYPMTGLFIARGCTQNCSICGGSKSSYIQICNREKPAIRSPKKLIEDVRFIKRFSKAPIFTIHDIRLPGKEYADELLAMLKKENIENEMVLELFAPADEAYFKRLNETFNRYSLEMTLESHDPELRRLNGKFPVSNEAIESTIAASMTNGCNRLDIYFMVGIPMQTPESVYQSVEYAKNLLERFGMDGRLQIYVAPLAPFLDPGSPAFENPEKFGYKLRAHTLEEHRQLLTKKTWSQILNYESINMPADVLVETTYEASARLVQIKMDLGLIEPTAGNQTIEMIAKARSLIVRINEASKLSETARSQVMETLHNEVRKVNQNRVYEQTDFVSWGKRKMKLKPLGLIPLMVELFFDSLSLAWIRYRSKKYRGTMKQSLQSNTNIKLSLDKTP